MAKRLASVLVLFPGALGDFLCALPALAALRAACRGRMRVVGRPAWLELIAWDDTTTVSIDRREVAELFGAQSRLSDPATALLGGFAVVHSWTGLGVAGFAARLRAVSGGRVRVHPFRGMRAGEHAIDYYARCVGLAPVPVGGQVLRCDAWLTHVDRPLLVIHPGSGSPVKNWEGFGLLAENWMRLHGGTVVAVCGPAEGMGPALPAAVRIVRDRTLPEVAGLLGQADVYVGNDSGVSHLAATVGARAVVLFGPTDPAIWAPRGSRVRVLCAASRCATCDPGRLCVHRQPVEGVLEAVELLARVEDRSD